MDQNVSECDDAPKFSNPAGDLRIGFRKLRNRFTDDLEFSLDGRVKHCVVLSSSNVLPVVNSARRNSGSFAGAFARAFSSCASFALADVAILSCSVGSLLPMCCVSEVSFGRGRDRFNAIGIGGEGEIPAAGFGAGLFLEWTLTSITVLNCRRAAPRVPYLHRLLEVGRIVQEDVRLKALGVVYYAKTLNDVRFFARRCSIIIDEGLGVLSDRIDER